MTASKSTTGGRQRLPLVGGLFRRLFFHHLILVTIPSAVLGILLVGLARSAIVRNLENDNREITLRAKGQIQGYANSVDQQLRMVAITLEQLGMEPRASDQFLNQIINTPDLTAFRRLYEIDTLRTIVATTNFDVRDPKVFPGEIQGPAAEALAGHPSSQPVRILGVGEPPTVVLSTPLYSNFGEVIGALVAEVDITDIWEVIDGIVLGEQGRAFLVNTEGTVIAHRNKAIVYERRKYGDLRSVQLALADSVGIIPSETAPSENEAMMAAFAPIRASGLTWALVIHRPLSEVKASERRMTLQIFAVVAIGIALALISTLVYTRRLVRPIGALVEGANRLSQGDLSYKIPVAGRDELGTLATEFNLMAERLSRIQERLRRVEHLDTLAKFSSVVAHEIRNPLNAMQINLHLLQERVEKEEQQYLDVLSAEIHRLENLVREFQTISRPPALSTQPTDVNQLLTDLVSLQRGTAEAQGVELIAALDPGLGMIEMDRNRITQAVLNLVLNAQQAMPNGGRLTIRTVAQRDSGGVLIEVSDTGEGIAEEDLGRVFDFYYTSRDSGSGLGLSISQQIVDEHGGQMTLESTVGAGTAIRIVLPDRPPRETRDGDSDDR